MPSCFNIASTSYINFCQYGKRIEVVLENDSDGTAKLSKQSQLDLENVLANDSCSEADTDEIAELL